ncbi:MAG: 1,4-beta-xylanase, partial [Oscillospiraceae bacterium]|nr:1,4-beta-xylanase [Oscillospiraceae bacterium]
QGYWAAQKTAEVLARFGRFGLPLHFTEINLVSGSLMPEHIVDLNDHKAADWPSTPEGERRQAEEAASFYRALFEHPLVEAVTWWDFADGGWLNAPSGLVTAAGAAKPSYQALYDLIKGEWWTRELRVRTDANGMAEVSGFKGSYTAEFDGGSMEFEIE